MKLFNLAKMISPKSVVYLFVFLFIDQALAVLNDTTHSNSPSKTYWFPLKKLLQETFEAEVSHVPTLIINTMTSDTVTEFPVITHPDTETKPTDNSNNREYPIVNNRPTDVFVTTMSQIVNRTDTKTVQHIYVSSEETVSTNNTEPAKISFNDIEDMINTGIIKNENIDIDSQFEMMTLMAGSVDFGVLLKSLLNETEDVPLVPDFLKSSLQRLHLSPACYEDKIRIYQDFLNIQIYAIRIFDATAKLPSGILDGKAYWPGSYHECSQAVSDFIPEFGRRIEGRQCMLTIPLTFIHASAFHANLNDDIAVIKYGTCQPKSCNVTDVKKMFKAAVGGEQVPIAQMSCDKPLPISNGIIVTCTVFGVLVLLVIMGTLYDIITSSEVKDTPNANVKNKKEPEPQTNKCFEMDVDIQHIFNITLDGKDGTSKPMLTVAGSTPPSYESVQNENKTRKSSEPKNPTSENKSTQKGKLAMFFMTFSILNNTKKLLHYTSAGNPLSSLNGIRVISITWVIMGHIFNFAIFTVDNPLTMWEHRSWMSAQPIINATFSVDSFFVMSGLLVTYLTLNELRRTKGRINWLMFYFHRFYRLIPVLGFVMLLEIFLRPYLYSGPYSYDQLEDPEENIYCRYDWWTNLLFINNFYRYWDTTQTKRPCMYHSWFLSVDVQFYLFSPIIISIMHRKHSAGVTFASFLAILSVVIRGLLVYYFGLTKITGKPSKHMEHFFEEDHILYDKPYTRMSPYLLGMILGYILHQTNCKIKIPKVLLVIGWCLAVIIGVPVIYGVYDHYDTPMGPTQSLAYLSLCRIGWGLAVSWVIFVCATGNAGLLNRFFSLSIWTPFARLTYCAYLIHPPLMVAYFINNASKTHFTIFNLFVLFLCMVVFTFALAYVLSMILEAPSLILEKLLFRRPERNEKAKELEKKITQTFQTEKTKL